MVLRTFVLVDNQFHNMLLFINTGNVRPGNQLNPQCPALLVKQRQLGISADRGVNRQDRSNIFPVRISLLLPGDRQ